MIRKVLTAIALVAVVTCGLAVARRGGEDRGNLPPRVRAGVNVNVSDARGAQSEAALAIDPSRPRILLAGSNDIGSTRMRVYESQDEGRTWERGLIPLPPRAGVCATSDPSVAIGADGRRFYGFLGIPCRRDQRPGVYVATRGDGGRWRTYPHAVAHAGRLTLSDDRPSIAADAVQRSPHRGRLYAAWTRFSVDPYALWADPDEEGVDVVGTAALVSYSDDGGRRWAKPTTLRGSASPHEIRLAVGLHGAVYAVWRDVKSNAIFIAVSRDGGKTFSRGSLVAAAEVRSEESCHSARARIPAQPKRCVSSNPVVATDVSSGPRAGSVYVVWNSTALNRSQDVDVAAYDASLHPDLGVGRVAQVNPLEGIRGPDQFLPTAAVDRADGRLWACYYQSVGRSRRSARFTCTASDDGGSSWSRPVAVARKPSDESRRPANVANGYGDYEAVVAANGHALAAWTDGRRLATRREEIYVAPLTALAAPLGR